GVQPLGQARGDAGAVDFRIVAFVPDDRQRLEGAFRMPIRVGDHGDRTLADAYDLLHAGALGDRGLVIALELAAEHRAILERGQQHAGHFDVDRVDLAAVELRPRVEALQRLAGDGPGFR